jgi:hypothetical protein
MSQMWQFLNPVGIWFHQQLTKKSEKTIKQYYEDVNRSTLSKELVEVLGKLVDDPEHLRDILKQKAVTSEDGLLHWDEGSFKKWVTTDQPLSVISTFIPTLWRVFVYFAGFLFTEPTFKDSEGPVPQQQRIDEDGFVQAYSLLALSWVELLGNAKDGFTPRGVSRMDGVRNLLVSRRSCSTASRYPLRNWTSDLKDSSMQTSQIAPKNNL